MQYLKSVFYVLLLALLFLTGCAVNDIESDFPPVYPNEDRQIDKDMPTPLFISDDRTFYLC